MTSKLIGVLAAGPLDIVGDIHGEIDALKSLLHHLGYGDQGEHADQRQLVFVGDLCDRGPDSLAVVRLVADLMRRGRAQCVLGNHEINLLRGSPKNGNGWFFAHDHDRERGRFIDSKPATEADRKYCLDFFGSLPLALERKDLRVVHAAWLPECIAQFNLDQNDQQDVMSLYHHYEQSIEAQFVADGLKAEAQREYQQYSEQLTDPTAALPMLPALALEDEIYQMRNPIRVVTSGVERRAKNPFFASGKWRMVERVPWWNEYLENTPVIIGHYWRWISDYARTDFSKGERDLFAEGGPSHWAGPHRNVYCVDYSVGGRFKERAQGRAENWQTRLAAVRWPEQELVFDEGERVELRKFT